MSNNLNERKDYDNTTDRKRNQRIGNRPSGI